MQAIPQIPNFGFCKDGKGKVVYFLSRESVIEDLKIFEEIANKSLGQGRWSEYDPSIIETDNYVIEDEQNLYNLLSTSKPHDDLIRSFFIEIFDHNIAVIFINLDKSIISVVNRFNDSLLRNIDENSCVFAREYDDIEDY